MLSISNLTASVGDRRLLNGVSFTINHGDRLGLVGPNGAGKTTLLRLIASDLRPESGSLIRVPGLRVGFLRQGFADTPDMTLAGLLARTSVQTGHLVMAQMRVEAAATALGAAADDAAMTAALAEYEAADASFADAGGYPSFEPVLVLLASLGLDAVPLDTPLDTLSGGQKTRAGLAAILAESPDVLLLDEPTNHLDQAALVWLESFLASYPGAALIVSHDRAFLDRTVTTTLALDPESGHITAYAGGYSAFLAARAAAAASHAAAFDRQQREISRITSDIRNVASHAQQTEQETDHDYIRGRAKKVARTAKVRERKLERLLTSEEKLGRPDRAWGLDLEFAATPTGRDVIMLRGVGVALCGREILHDVDLHIRHGERVAITGPNGAGKSTLLRLITGELPPDRGLVRLGAGVRPGWQAQEQSTVRLDQSVLAQVRAAAPLSEVDARNFLHKFLFGGDAVFQLGSELSYGERSRLALALLILSGANVLLLDEPLNHLDAPAREQFETALLAFPGTVLVVLHDRYAIDRLADRVLTVEHGTVREEFVRGPAVDLAG